MRQHPYVLLDTIVAEADIQGDAVNPS